jgi:hypothetical protein
MSLSLILDKTIMVPDELNNDFNSSKLINIYDKSLNIDVEIPQLKKKIDSPLLKKYFKEEEVENNDITLR